MLGLNLRGPQDTLLITYYRGTLDFNHHTWFGEVGDGNRRTSWKIAIGKELFPDRTTLCANMTETSFPV